MVTNRQKFGVYTRGEDGWKVSGLQHIPILALKGMNDHCPPMERKTASDFDQELLDLYDYYVHGRLDRREFLDQAKKFAVGGLTAAALLGMLNPQYALATQVEPDDDRIKADRFNYKSPNGHGDMQGLLARPANAKGKLPAVVVVHENRGLNPYVEDVARRLAVAGYLALAPDALYPIGGYPGNDDEGRTMQRKLDREKVTEDFVAAAEVLHTHEESSGKVGVVGFCFGGGMSNTLAWRLPNIIKAAVPYYGGQATAEQAAMIKAPLLLQYAELDKRVNAGWPAYEEALKANDIEYTAHMYPGVNHGFHNDTTPRYDETAAELSWKRTVAFFDKHLKG